MASETVKITITSTGAVTVKKELTEIGVAAKGASGNVEFMRSALAGLVAFISVSTFTQYSDAVTRVSNSLKMAGVSGAEFTAIQEQLYSAAIKNGQEAENLAAIYQKGSAVQKQLGLDSQELITLTTGIASAMRMSTSGVAAQSGALQQLSQLFGGTKVQAQEFNSLVDGAYPLLIAAANGSDKWKGSVAALTNDVRASNVTVKEFVDALRAGLPAVQAQAEALPLTIGQAITSLTQSFQYWIATSSSATQAGALISQGILLLGDNISMVIPAIVAIGAAMAASFGVKFLMSLAANLTSITMLLIRFGTTLIVTIIPAIASFAIGLATLAFNFALALPGIIAATAAFVAANAVIIGIVAIVAVLAGGLLYLYDVLANGGQGFASFEAAATQAVNSVKTQFQSVLSFLGNGTANINVTAQQAAQQLLQSSTQGADQIRNGVQQGANQGGKEIATSITDAAKQVSDPIKTGIVDGVQTSVDQINTALKASGQELSTVLTTAGTAIGQSISAALTQAGTTVTTGFSNWGSAFVKNFTAAGTQFINAFKSAAQQAANALRAAAASAASPGAGGGPAFAGGGQFRVGGSGGTDSQKVSFRATPNERVTVETPKQQRERDAAQKTPAVNVQGGGNNVVNVFDPMGMIDALGSRAGRDAQLNFVRANRAEIAAALGVA